jgi:hypothetical protein
LSLRGLVTSTLGASTSRGLESIAAPPGRRRRCGRGSPRGFARGLGTTLTRTWICFFSEGCLDRLQRIKIGLLKCFRTIFRKTNLVFLVLLFLWVITSVPKI